MSTTSRRNTVFQRMPRLLLRAVKSFLADKVPRLGAALAFYTVVAVAPMLVVAISVAGLFFGDEGDARERVLGEIERLIGSQAGAALQGVDSPVSGKTGTVATTVSVVMILLGVVGVFGHLQDALNTIWRVDKPKGAGGWRMIRKRLFSMGTMLVTAFLLLISLVISAALSWLGTHTIQRMGLPEGVMEALNFVLSFAVVTILFAVLFRLLPDTKVRWRHVWAGAAFTAVLFTAGKTVLGYYLANSSAVSAYGAASSIMALLVWCYYASQIFLFGAEFTRVTDRTEGGRDFSHLDDHTRRNLSI